MKIVDPRIELAKGLLAAGLVSHEARLTMIRMCCPEDFPEGVLRRAFVETCTLDSLKGNVGMVVIADRCPDLAPLVMELAERVPNPEAAPYYAQRLSEERYRRCLRIGVAEMTEAARDEDLSLAQLSERLDRIWSRVSDVRPRSENRLLCIDEVPLPESFHPEHTCGFAQWEQLTAGFCPELFHLVYGRAGIGKSTWMAQATGELAQAGVPCLVISLEMSPKHIKRMQVDQGFRGVPIFVWERPSGFLPTLKADIEYAVRAKGIRVVAIDHLGLLSCKTEGGRIGEIEQIMRELFVFGRDRQISTLLLWHENREGKLRYRCDGFPDSITRLECEDAKVPRPEVFFTVEKARHGKEGIVLMMFNRLLRRFEEKPWTR